MASNRDDKKKKNIQSVKANRRPGRNSDDGFGKWHAMVESTCKRPHLKPSIPPSNSMGSSLAPKDFTDRSFARRTVVDQNESRSATSSAGQLLLLLEPLSEA